MDSGIGFCWISGDGASRGVLGNSLEFPQVLALLPWAATSGHHQRCITLPSCMSDHDCWKFCYHPGALASPCILDILLYSKSQTARTSSEACDLHSCNCSSSPVAY